MAENITYEGVKNRKVERKAAVGDLIFYVVDDSNTGVSRVSAEEFDVDDFYTEDGAYIWVACGDSYVVLEEEAEPQPDVHALLANIGCRLHEVEAALEDAKDRKYYDDMVAAYQDTPEDATSDAVNSPAHYKRGKFETIEVIEHITAGYDDPFVAYCVGNAVKYADRAPYKHDSPAECLRKAAWYLSRAAEHTEASE